MCIVELLHRKTAARRATRILLKGMGLNQKSKFFCLKNAPFRRRAEQTGATQVHHRWRSWVSMAKPQPLGDFCNFLEKRSIPTLFGLHLASFCGHTKELNC